MRNKGFALLQVLIVFAILSAIAASMLYEQRIQIERASQNLFLSQSAAYFDSTEALAKVILKLDQELTDIDHLSEQWNLIQGEIPLAMILQTNVEGTISAEINDLQGRFNINWLSLSHENRQQSLVAFKRLLTLIELDIVIADELYNWFDESSGAEYEYLQNQPSYMPSFAAMSDVSELLLLNSVDSNALETLRPYVSALPWYTELNLNTAPVEVIQTIADYIDEPTALGLVDERAEEGITSPDVLLSYPVFQQNEGRPLLLNALTVSSHWFELFVETRIDNRALRQASLLQRTEADVEIVGRNRSAMAANRVPGDEVKATTSDSQLVANATNE